MDKTNAGLVDIRDADPNAKIMEIEGGDPSARLSVITCDGIEICWEVDSGRLRYVDRVRS